MEKHFRIIELEERQVLLTKDFKVDEQDVPAEELVVSFFLDGVRINQVFGFSPDNVKERDTMFEKFTKEDAESIVNGVIEMIDKATE